MSIKHSSPPAIYFNNIRVDFSGTVLFDNLSFTIKAGQCTCILGPSGCGKSTLLRIVSGNPDIRYTGELSFSPAAESIGWMSQNDLLLPWLTLHENVMLGARLRGEIDNNIGTQALRLLQRAGLASYEKALPATLSGGMRQRGALLRTLMEESGLMLMDEPFSALDALTRTKLQNLTVEMTKGRTVLLVTHDPMEALRMGHEIIVFSGSPAKIHTIKTIPGEVPRQLSDPSMASMHADLLAMLMTEEHESV